MIGCDIKNSRKYQTFKKMSGTSEYFLDKAIEQANLLGLEYPYLDQITGVNSEPYLQDNIKVDTIKDTNYSSKEDILNYTGTQSIPEALIELNNKHRDLNIKLVDCGDSAIVKIEHRPTASVRKSRGQVETNTNLDSNKLALLIESRLEELGKMFGIQITPVTEAELAEGNWPPNALLSNGFIFNNNIYINTDKANIQETKIHELMHMFLGMVRYTNPDVYMSLIQSILPELDMEYLSTQFPNRTEMDVLEEALVQEYARYLTDLPSVFNDSNTLLLNYEFLRNLDSFIDGTYSAKAYPLKHIGNQTISLLITDLNSDIGNTVNPFVEAAQIHRMTANLKEKLMEEGKLELECS